MHPDGGDGSVAVGIAPVVIAVVVVVAAHTAAAVDAALVEAAIGAAGTGGGSDCGGSGTEQVGLGDGSRRRVAEAGWGRGSESAHAATTTTTTTTTSTTTSAQYWQVARWVLWPASAALAERHSPQRQSRRPSCTRAFRRL